jgi:hypothetical protein
VYALFDLIIPTIASVIIFRYPVHQLVTAARHFIKLLFNALTFVLKHIGAPASAIHTVHGWEGPAVANWQITWIALMIFIGLLNIYLVAIVSDMVLNQIPEETLASQRAA